MEEKTTLLPCPFCGGEANTVLKGSDDWHIECHDCASRSGIYGIRESAIAAWNTRAERTCTNNASPYFDFLCSECGFINYHNYMNNTDQGNRWNYCPDCGAKVVEE